MESRFSETSYKQGVVSGYALYWNTESFVPQIGRKESFTKGSLKIPENGIPLYWQHNKHAPLGNTKSGTLKIREDDKGLFYECTLPKSALKERELLERGDMQGASITFYPTKETNRGQTRVVECGVLDHLAIVTRPAHKGTLHYRDKPVKPRRKWGSVLWEY